MTLAAPPITRTGRRIQPAYDHCAPVEYALWLAWRLARYTGLAYPLRPVIRVMAAGLSQLWPAIRAIARVGKRVAGTWLRSVRTARPDTPTWPSDWRRPFRLSVAAGIALVGMLIVYNLLTQLVA